jgi:hypothetical protein
MYRFFDNDRRSHWFGAVLVSWVGIYIFLMLVLHKEMKFPAGLLSIIVGIGCLMNLVVTPTLFSARRIRPQRVGNVPRIANAILVQFTITGAAAVLCLLYMLPSSASTRHFEWIFLSVWVFYGVVGLVVVHFVFRGKSKS